MAAELKSGGLYGFLKMLLEMEKKTQKKLCRELKEESKNRTEPHWEWVAELLGAYPWDAGTMSPLFLNLVNLSPGEAMYLPAGELHAYLRGMGIELMASSDNVLRGGLTQKYIDPDELLRILTFQPSIPDILHPRKIHNNIGVYDTPAGEFILSVIRGTAEDLPLEIPDEGVSIYINMKDGLDISSPSGRTLHISKGESFLSEHSTESLTLNRAAGGEFHLYRAGVPQ